MPDRLGTIRRDAREKARSAAVEPRDVDLLLGDLIGRDPIYVIAHDHEVISADQRSAFEEQLERRLQGEPLQYIRGQCEFFGRSFRVDRRVLIPRPETEILCEKAISITRRGMRVVDIGCGSGAIAVTIALERPDVHVFATDKSFAALLLARDNARRLGAAVKHANVDLLAGLNGRFDLLVSNPPYVPEEEIPRLQREVSEHEPHLALSGGPGGFALIEGLIRQAALLLAPRGAMLVEIGWNQSQRVAALARDTGWSIDIIRDLSGIDRCVVLRRDTG